MKAYSWINFVLGCWLIVASFVFTYSFGMHPATTQEVVMGVIIAALACWSAIAHAQEWLAWLVGLAGLVTLGSPLWTNYQGISTFARANDVVVGLVVLLLGCASAVARHKANRIHA